VIAEAHHYQCIYKPLKENNHSNKSVVTSKNKQRNEYSLIRCNNTHRGKSDYTMRYTVSTGLECIFSFQESLLCVIWCCNYKPTTTTYTTHESRVSSSLDTLRLGTLKSLLVLKYMVYNLLSSFLTVSNFPDSPWTGFHPRVSSSPTNRYTLRVENYFVSLSHHLPLQ